MTYSDNERKLFAKFGYLLNENNTKLENYQGLANFCFALNKSGPLVDSVRKILPQLINCDRTNVEIFIDLSETPDTMPFIDRKITFASTLLCIEQKNFDDCLKAMQSLSIKKRNHIEDPLINEFDKWGFSSYKSVDLYFLNNLNYSIRPEHHSLFKTIARFVKNGQLSFQSQYGPNEIYSWNYVFQNQNVYLNVFDQVERDRILL